MRIPFLSCSALASGGTLAVALSAGLQVTAGAALAQDPSRFGSPDVEIHLIAAVAAHVEDPPPLEDQILAPDAREGARDLRGFVQGLALDLVGGLGHRIVDLEHGIVVAQVGGEL